MADPFALLPQIGLAALSLLSGIVAFRHTLLRRQEAERLEKTRKDVAPAMPSPLNGFAVLLAQASAKIEYLEATLSDRERQLAECQQRHARTRTRATTATATTRKRA